MKHLTLSQVKEIIEDNVPDVESLVQLLELTIEDIMKRFPDKLMEHKDKFTLESEEDYYEDDD